MRRFEAIEEAAEVCRCGEERGRVREQNTECLYAFQVETKLYVFCSCETPKHHTRAGDEYQCQCDFCGHQELANPDITQPGRGAACDSPERVDWFTAGELPRGKQAEEDGREQCCATQNIRTAALTPASSIRSILTGRKRMMRSMAVELRNIPPALRVLRAPGFR